MKYFTAAALFAGVALATSPSVTTETVTAFTTFCPEATTLTHGSSTITVSTPTTITLSCPNGCTVTRPVYSTSSVVCPTTSVSAAPSTSPIGSAPYTNGTTTVQVTSVVPTGSIPASTTSKAPLPSGGANKAMTASGAGLAAALGFAAFFM